MGTIILGVETILSLFLKRTQIQSPNHCHKQKPQDLEPSDLEGLDKIWESINEKNDHDHIDKWPELYLFEKQNKTWVLLNCPIYKMKKSNDI